MIITTGKSQYLYESILKDIKTIILGNNIDLNKILKELLLDFEPGLQKSVRNIFNKAQILGFYFYYTKILWEKENKYGFWTKK